MLTEFFLQLRAGGVPASIKEYLTLIEGLQRHVASGSMDDFYYLARTSLVKDESHYDRFDRVFGQYFRGIQAMPDDLFAEVPLDWLRRQAELSLTDEEKQQIEAMGGWEKLMETLKKRLDNSAAVTRADRNGSVRPAHRRSAPTATTRRACASDRKDRVTGAPSRCGTSASTATSTTP